MNLQAHYINFLHKRLIFEKKTILNIGKNDLHAKTIAFAKSSLWVKK